MDKCTNCGNEFTGKYCAYCGQERIKRLEVKTIMHEVTHGILHWENSILKTAKELILKPGTTAKEYIAGKRKSFVKPFSYFIFMQTIFVVVFHRMSEKYYAFLTYTMQSDSQQALDKTTEIQHLVGQYINYLNYFMPVVFGFYLYLFFRKKTGINYAESLAASFYLVGTTLIFSVVLMLLSVIDISIWNARFFVNMVYYVFAIVKFTDTPPVKGILKGITVTFLSYFTFVILVMILIIGYLYFSGGLNMFHVVTSAPK